MNRSIFGFLLQVPAIVNATCEIKVKKFKKNCEKIEFQNFTFSLCTQVINDKIRTTSSFWQNEYSRLAQKGSF